MKKISFILSIFLIIGCEDEEGTDSPLVGTWTMTESSGGIYMMVNKTQYLNMGEVDGAVTASLHTDQGLIDSYSMTEMYINQNMDGTFINLMTPYDYDSSIASQASYQLADYTSSLNDYDFSQLSVSTMNDYYNFYNNAGNFTYSTTADDNGMHTLTIDNDTLYREVYINGNIITDSSRYGIVNGTIKEIGTQVQAGQHFSMSDDISLPSAITLRLDDDFTGSISEIYYGEVQTSGIRWFISPDSSFGWSYCYDESDGPEYCDEGPVFNNYDVTDNSLVLSMYQDMCDEIGSDCDAMMDLMYGVEMGTLDSYWAEINLTMKKSAASKQLNPSNHNLQTKHRPRSIFQEVAAQKRIINTIRRLK